MKIRYVGAHDAVDLTLPSGAIITATRRGDAIEVPEPLGTSLLEQADNWAPSSRDAKDTAKQLAEDEAARSAAEDAAAAKTAAGTVRMAGLSANAVHTPHDDQKKG
ncbi:MAG: hypothetical protein H0X39_16850 [Actinobacteria bacterium]|nr:hypothetical protein [Actinomycetota bacterium]